MLPPPHPPGDVCRMEGWECFPNPALPPPHKAPSLFSQEGLPVPPCFWGKSSFGELMTQGRLISSQAMKTQPTLKFSEKFMMDF